MKTPTEARVLWPLWDIQGTVRALCNRSCTPSGSGKAFSRHRAYPVKSSKLRTYGDNVCWVDSPGHTLPDGGDLVRQALASGRGSRTIRSLPIASYTTL